MLCGYILLQLGLWYFDDAAPISVINTKEVVKAVRGKPVRVIIPIIRTEGKKCSLLLSRYFEDSQGTYHDIMATRFASANARNVRSKTNPNELDFSVTIPEEAAVGQGFLMTQHSYMCNPVQYIWPIDFLIATPLDIQANP